MELQERAAIVTGASRGLGRQLELVDLLGERGLVDPDSAAPMSIIVETVLGIITADDPLEFTGQIVRAQPMPGG